jgi:HEAT repeat protein
MQRRQGKGKGGRPPGQETHRAEGPEERAQSLLLRLETSGPNPRNAAEELDRLQARLERDGRLEEVRDRVEALCSAWAAAPLRGERAQAWLTLVGAFDLKEHTPEAAHIGEDNGLPTPLRVQSCRVLARLGGDEARRALQSILESRSDAQVRAAAAEALADLGDRGVRPVLEVLLEEDLPRPVWNAVSAALDRLR